MNAPDRFELVILPDGVKKVSIQQDTRLSNAATFSFQKEDHTLATMLRTELLKDPRVLFAGYKVPHPLDHMFIIKIQTEEGYTPKEAMVNAGHSLINLLNTLKLKFNEDIPRARAFDEAVNEEDEGRLYGGIGNELDF